MTDKEMLALRKILLFTPWKRDKVSRAVGEYLDGKTDTIKGMPTVQGVIDEALQALSEAGRQGNERYKTDKKNEALLEEPRR